jgi:dihydroxyacetone kinase phosphotransfer subunit
VVNLVLVSHSHQLAQGLKSLAEEMSHQQIKIITAGGLDEHTLGTNAERIHQAIQKADSADGVLILFDLGSALLSTELAIEMLPPEQQNRVMLSQAPLVEGTIAAAVEAALGEPLTQVNRAAEACLRLPKLPSLH